MQTADLVDRLATLPNLDAVPRQELEWLVTHGELEVRKAGTVIAPKGKHIDKLWIILSGHISVQVDRGTGPRRVIDWRTGDVSGMLPYSRMTGPPGDNYLEARSELLTIRVENFPEMINRCPVFTAYTVHTMLDRARRFNASDLQDEKMVSLGKLAAGLAHEINNPASAMVRGAKQLLVNLTDADAASRALGAAGVTDDLFASIEKFLSTCMRKQADTLLSPIQKADREDEIAGWLERHQVDTECADLLASSAITIDMLDELSKMVSGDTLAFAIRWIATYCATRSLAVDIEQAATRISELVAAVKRFTYMDNLAGSDAVDVEAGLRDTIKVLAAKSKSKGATITLDVQENLPRVRATGSELNQVWMNLIDNALDAISDSGNIHISAQSELDRVVVSIADDGQGIPAEVLPRIFDAFFTTKPPGQGTGLGLEITRRLLRLYHGDITVESRPGRTEFRITLLVQNATSTGADEPNGDKNSQ